MNKKEPETSVLLVYPMYDQTEHVLDVFDSLANLVPASEKIFDTHLIREGYRSTSSKSVSLAQLKKKAAGGPAAPRPGGAATLPCAMCNQLV